MLGNARGQLAYKPGSVHLRAPRRLQGSIVIHLGRSLPNASRDRPGRRCENPSDQLHRSIESLPSLLGLAPGGVYRAVPVTGGAVRSYRTLSPLPSRAVPRHGRLGGLLSVALSLGLPPPGVTRHPVSVEPGLSSPLPKREQGDHPANWQK